MKEKITITINRKQAEVLHSALDLLSRLLAGQVEELDYFFRSQAVFLQRESSEEKGQLKNIDMDLLRDAVFRIKTAVFPELAPNESFGINNRYINRRSQIAYDVLQQLRYELYKFDLSKGREMQSFGVNSSPPINYSGETFPNITVDDNESESQ